MSSPVSLEAMFVCWWKIRQLCCATQLRDKVARLCYVSDMDVSILIISFDKHYTVAVGI